MAAIEWVLEDEIRLEIDEVFSEEGVSTHVETEQAV